MKHFTPDDVVAAALYSDWFGCHVVEIQSKNL
jgi:hypothetical protein